MPSLGIKRLRADELDNEEKRKQWRIQLIKKWNCDDVRFSPVDEQGCINIHEVRKIDLS